MCNTVDALIQFALLGIDRHDPWWALPLVEDLESRSPGRSLRCAISLAERRLARAPDREDFSQRRDWIRQLRGWSDNRVDPALAYKLSQDVWYAADGRDELQKAISSLFSALAVMRVKQRLYQQSVATSITLLTVDSRGQPLPSAVGDLIDTYRDDCSQ